MSRETKSKVGDRLARPVVCAAILLARRGGRARLFVEVAALVVGAAVFLIRGWVGYFPSKLSTTGAEYLWSDKS